MSLKDASADITDLEQFQKSLNAYADALLNETNRAIAAMNHVNQTWNDRVQQEFMDIFQQNLQHIARMRDIVNNHSLYVKKKIDILRDYAQNGAY